MALTTHIHLALGLNSTAIPLLPLWAFITGYKVSFGFTFNVSILILIT